MSVAQSPKDLGKAIAYESAIKAGELGVNNAYDLTLVQKPSGDYVLVLSMKIQFFFEAKGLSKWKTTEKDKFIKNWEKTVFGVWDGIVLRSLSDKKLVTLKLHFQTQIEGWMFDHWEITVRKVPPGSAFRSYVNPALGNVVLTDRDNVAISRHVRGTGKFNQLTTAHEFGHMIGLDDEYGPLFGGEKGPHNGDYSSVMNIGSIVRDRHKQHLKLWLDKALKEHDIK